MDARRTGGAAVASLIVAVTVAGLPTVAFVADVATIVSAPSTRLSWRLVRVMVPVVLPAGIVMLVAEAT